MEPTSTSQAQGTVITAAELLAHWQGHRSLTRRVIEAFPANDFFTFSIGGMRTAAELVQELLAIAGPGVRQIATGSTEELNERLEHQEDKEVILAAWDKSTEEVNRYWAMIPEGDFHREIMTFGQYPGTILSSVLYFIDNEIHHRGQMYVYLRALGIEPPYFWQR